MHCQAAPLPARITAKESKGDGVRPNRPYGLITPGRAPWDAQEFFVGSGGLPAVGRRAEGLRHLQIVLLILFGAAGTLARYALQGVGQYRTGPGLPTGTLAVNLLGCFLLGAAAPFALHRLWIPPEWRVALTIGFFGAFTTFSTFGWETVKMLEDGEWLRAAAYVGLSVFGGLVAVLAGIRLADLL